MKIDNKLILALMLPVFLTVVAIWLPFGFALTGLIEEWDLLGLFTSHGVFFVTDINSPLAAHAARPLTALPHATAFFLDPNSFYYWHLLLIFVLLVKGGASGYLILKATCSIRWAALMGVLVLVYPADTMQMSFRALHINMALALSLLASSLLVIGYYERRRNLSYVICTMAAAIMFSASLMYEVALVLTPLPLMIIFVRDGLLGLLNGIRSNRAVFVIWAVGASAYVTYALLVASMVTSYQASISGTDSISVLSSSLPKLFSVGALRGFFGGWFDAFRIVSTEYVNHWYLIFAVSVTGIISLFALSLIKAENSQALDNVFYPRMQPIRVAIAGVLLMLLGYTPFLLLPSHQVISQRTFLWVAPGAAMLWIALLVLISWRTRLLAVSLSLALFYFGLGAQIFQMHHYVQIADRQQKLIRAIIENFDGELGEKTLIVLDGTNQLGHTWMFRPDSLPLALTYLYGHSVNSVEICHSPSMEWQRSDNLALKGKCIELDDGWIFEHPTAVEGPGYSPSARPSSRKLTEDQVIIVNINADGSVLPAPELEVHRKNLYSGDTLLSKRYLEVIDRNRRPFNLLNFRDQSIGDNYKWDFGNWWSLELPTRGSGWREAEWDVGSLYHKSTAWKNQKESALYFNFAPTEKVYILRANFPAWVSDQIKQSLQVSLNKTNVIYRWVTEDVIEAEIKKNILHNGVNEIIFASNIDENYFGLSAKIDWFEVRRK